MRWGLAEQLQMWPASTIRTISPPSWTVRHSSSSYLAVGRSFTPRPPRGVLQHSLRCGHFPTSCSSRFASDTDLMR